MTWSGMRCWRNWLGNQRCTADYFEPRDDDELVDDVARVVGAPKTRPVGGLFAWNAVVPVERGGRLVAATRLDRCLGIEGRVVHVEAGMTIRALVELTRKHKLALRSPPIFDRLTVGGVLSVGGHGSDTRVAGLGDSVLEVTLIRVNGGTEVLEPRHGDCFLAACAGLGSLGVLRSVKIECDADCSVEVHSVSQDIHALVLPGALEDLVRSHDYVEISWFLLSRFVGLRLMDRTEAPADPFGLGERVRDWVYQGLGSLFGDRLIPWIARSLPWLLRPLLQALHAIADFTSPVLENLSLSGTPGEPAADLAACGARPICPSPVPEPPPHPIEPKTAWTRFVGRLAGFFQPPDASLSCAVRPWSVASHHIHTYPKAYGMEFAVPMAQARWALSNVIYKILQEGEKGQMPINLAVYVRFTGCSHVLLPARRGTWCHIDIATTPGNGSEVGFLDDLFHFLVTKCQGRPHLGKYFPEEPDWDAIRSNYDAAAWRRFEAVRAKMDPDGRLLNRFLCSLFGLQHVGARGCVAPGASLTGTPEPGTPSTGPGP